MSVDFSTRIGPGFVTTPTFKPHFFHAGEAHVEVINENDGKGELTEVARIWGADGNDLMLLAQWSDAAERRGSRRVLQMPYLPGARADHPDFVPLGAQVYANFINSIWVDQVIALDPHSDGMPAMVHHLTVLSSAPIIRRHVVGRADSDEQPQRYAGIIAPDKGAVARATAVAEACHLPLYRAEKHRDPETRELSGFSCEQLPETGRFLVVDDICDGGGTFIGLAKATGLPKERLGLFVSHGVYTARAWTLSEFFEDIWTTDSFASDPKPTGIHTAGRPLHFHTIPIATYLNGAIAR